MIWPTAGGLVRTGHDAPAAQRSDVAAQRVGTTAPRVNATALRAGATVPRAGAKCQFIGSPGGPARCDHHGDRRTAGRLHPSGIDLDDAGIGLPADGPAAGTGQHSAIARPPSRPSLAQLQVWRR
ncbi:hypothetical protein [Dactylosporangium sp. NPDC005555]|uniref:hypothetical protein n=1 Tax=Dactylosporangium sp. NPDC005555 TaxID=3154889 RepID=UPI0033B639CA